ncbi:MAG: hypothetical protein K5755_03450 [Clostridiales bacterium]|nr:hypothetical protein [Clostridiales bacterium]
MKEYIIQADDETVGYYYKYDKDFIFRSYFSDVKNHKKEIAEKKLDKDIDSKKPIEHIEKMIVPENRVGVQKQDVFKDGGFTVIRIPQQTDERYVVYRASAEKGEDGYSKTKFVVPHNEGPGTPEGMNEWASWYIFYKMDDGTYEAELDEAWFWGGGHNDGGTINAPIPEEWFGLSYDEFLENVITLAHAGHYGFTSDILKKKKGLKEFFGFEGDNSEKDR